MNTSVKGRSGEEQAAKYLSKKKYKILEMNFTAANCEVDIVAKRGDTIVFVEVKSRLSEIYGLPREAVTKTKQQHIARAAAAYIQRNKLSGKPVRFDVIEISGGGINHMENAFEL